MDEHEIRRKARDFAREFMDGAASGHPEEITADWLMSIHPELDAEEAEEYRLFCKRNTIVFRGCYDRGQIMWPEWQAFKAEIRSL